MARKVSNWKKLPFSHNTRGGKFIIRHNTTGEFKEFPLENVNRNLFNNAWKEMILRCRADAEAKRDAFIEDYDNAHGMVDPKLNPHKHAAVIIAWTNGRAVEGQSPTTDIWQEAPGVNDLGVEDNYLLPSPIHPEYDWWEWRIKND